MTKKTKRLPFVSDSKIENDTFYWDNKSVRLTPGVKIPKQMTKKTKLEKQENELVKETREYRSTRAIACDEKFYPEDWYKNGWPKDLKELLELRLLSREAELLTLLKEALGIAYCSLTIEGYGKKSATKRVLEIRKKISNL